MAAVIGSVLVTGAAGFIGYHVVQRLLKSGNDVIGVDSLSSYYDPALKQARLDQLSSANNFHFIKLDLADREATQRLFRTHKCSHVVHLAAAAGVRFSILNPAAYVDANLTGFANVLEGCRHNDCKHLLYASTSSVYGANEVPYSTHDNVDHPLTLYGATKKANELMAHAYSNLFALPATGMRFFTVYGPWGRPDMAMWLFTSGILKGTPIKLFNGGRMFRDFTYVDDVVESVVRLLDHIPVPAPQGTAVVADPATSAAPWRIYNIGTDRPIEVVKLLALLEEEIGRSAKIEVLPMQPGDVQSTWADVSDLSREIGFSPQTPIEVGVRRFVEWYRGYHKQMT